MNLAALIFQTTDPTGPNYRTRDGLTAVFTKDLSHQQLSSGSSLIHRTPASGRPLDRTLFLSTATSDETRMYALHIFMNMALVVPINRQFSDHHLAADLPRILNYLVETVRTIVSDATIANHIGFKVFVYATCRVALEADRQKVLPGFGLVKASTGVTALGEKLIHDHCEYSRTLTFGTDFSLQLGASSRSSSSPGLTTTKDQSTSTSDLALVDPVPSQSSLTSIFAPHSTPAQSEHKANWWMPSAATAAFHTVATSSADSVLRRGNAFNYGHQRADVPPLAFGTGSSAPIFSFGMNPFLQKPP